MIMTKKEYEQICKMIDESKSEIWLTPYHCSLVIEPRGISNLKKQIKELVKER